MPKLNKALLTPAELRCYKARSTAGAQLSANLPADQQQRMRTWKHRYWALASALVAGASAVGAGTGGEPAAVIAAAAAAFLTGCLLGTVYQLQCGFAAQRWANDYLTEIGYHTRTQPPGNHDTDQRARDRDHRSGRDHRYPVTDGRYDPEEYQRRGGYATKQMMDALGFDNYDSYRSNFSD